MAQQYLRKPIEYASGGVYVAPGKPWDGNARFIAPTDSQLITGATPDQAVVAEYENGRMKVLFDAQAVQCFNALQFARTDFGTTSFTKLTAVTPTTPIGAAANRPKSIFASGPSGGGLFLGMLLNDGTNVSASSSLAGIAPPSAPAADANGVIFSAVSGSSIPVQTANGGASVSNVTVTGIANPAIWVGMTGTRYLVVESSTLKLHRATSLGGAWTNTTPGMTNYYDLATNGAGRCVIAGANAAVFKCLFSTDDGATWATSSTTFAGAAGTVGMCYWDYYGVFVAVTSGGLVYTSGDGDTWTLQKTVASLSSLTLGQNTVATCGPVLAVIANRAVNSQGKYPYGVAVTLDVGATWNDIYIGAPATSTDLISNLISANGRFYATDGKALYRSGLLVTPAAQYTGV
jgi:hypothetical protein